MPNNQGTLVFDAIRPNAIGDDYPTAWSTEIKGGLHTVTASSDRNLITTKRREWGMMCYVIDDNKTYQLIYGYNSTTITDNNNWVEFNGSNSSGGEWINSVISVLLTEPALPSDGERYLVGVNPGDSITGTNWSTQQPGVVAQWSSSLSSWSYTTPLDGMSVRVDNQDNSIYRYEGDYPTGSWEKEKESQVRYIDAQQISGGSYSAISDPYLNDYDKEIVYLVKFSRVNTGLSASLSINNLPHKTVKRINGQSLVDIVSNELSVNYQYIVTYNGTFFELLDPSNMGGNGLDNKYYITDTETIDRKSVV